MAIIKTAQQNNRKVSHLVKAETEEKHRIYLDALMALRKIITQDYNEGGWLPAERTMCERLKVSRVTYRKVLGWLSAENILRSVPRRGHWVVDKSRRCVKIGLVLREGTESPFLGDNRMMASFFEACHRNKVNVHLIQASRLDSIHFSAASHAVSGLIWVTPPAEAFDHIKTIANTSDLPTVAIIQSALHLVEKIDDFFHVSLDFAGGIQTAARFLIQRNHRSIAYVSCCGDHGNNVLLDSYRDAGLPCEPDRVITRLNNIEESLEQLKQKYDISAILSDGGWERVDAIRDFCVKQGEKQPELIIPKQMGSITEKNPTLRVIGHQQFVGCGKLAEIAIDTLAKNLLNDTPLKSTLVPAYEVTPT